MVSSQGNWNPTENCFLTTYHPSFMVHWWVLVHSDPFSHLVSPLQPEPKNNVLNDVIFFHFGIKVGESFGYEAPFTLGVRAKKTWGQL